MTLTQTKRITLLALAFSAAALAAPVAADDAKPEHPSAPTPPVVQLPEELPPVLTGRTVSGRVTPDTPPAGAPAGELDGLRAVTLREGAAELSLGGKVRKVKVGDALGSGTVRAIGADRIVLERPFSVPGGTPSRATVIVTFGKGGVPRVRTFVDVGALPQPVPFEEAH
jgi:hypothetical protein